MVVGVAALKDRRSCNKGRRRRRRKKNRRRKVFLQFLATTTTRPLCAWFGRWAGRGARCGAVWLVWPLGGAGRALAGALAWPLGGAGASARRSAGSRAVTSCQTSGVEPARRWLAVCGWDCVCSQQTAVRSSGCRAVAPCAGVGTALVLVVLVLPSLLLLLRIHWFAGRGGGVVLLKFCFAGFTGCHNCGLLPL